ncbi:hypothetical protein KC326_g35 [Hortaea werneckii]|nr:hypothetical protein KC326_g35 [Hortaea werneckii]
MQNHSLPPPSAPLRLIVLGKHSGSRMKAPNDLHPRAPYRASINHTRIDQFRQSFRHPFDARKAGPGSRAFRASDPDQSPAASRASISEADLAEAKRVTMREMAELAMLGLGESARIFNVSTEIAEEIELVGGESEKAGCDGGGDTLAGGEEEEDAEA